MIRVHDGRISKRTWTYEGKKHCAYGYSLTVDEGGKRRRYRKQFATRAEAQGALDAFKDDLKQPKLRAMSLGEAITLYLEAKARKRSLAEDDRVLTTFRDLWGADTPLAQITAAKISAWQAEALRRTATNHGQTVAPATINRALAALRHLLRLSWRRRE